MGPIKRTRRARIRREVGTEAQPAQKRTRKGRKPVEEPTAEPVKRSRKAMAKKSKAPRKRPPGFLPLDTDTTEEG